jgi:branched-chain amino acid transport system ATP-binding protein
LTFFKVENLSIEFGGLKALQGISFEVEEGQIYTIVGPNGAGKTTVFNLLSRIYNPTEGKIFFQDKEITKYHPYRIARLGIARTFQNIELFENASVLHNLLVGCHIHRSSNVLSELLHLPSVRKMELRHRRKTEEIIDFLDLQHYRYQLIANLPYGIRKIVELGRALCTDPKIILLDEPVSGLNVEETEDMSFWIEDIKKILSITVIMIEHNMNIVSQVSDRVLALNEGKILAEGSADEIQRNPSVIKAYLGEENGL